MTTKASLKAQAEIVALRHNIPTSTLENLIKSESEWNPDAVGDHNCSFGLLQINTCVHKVSKKDALDPGFALEWAADRIDEGHDWWWTSCNCYSLVSTRVDNLPLMNKLLPNGKAEVGGVVIFQYTDKNTGKPVKHVAYILGVSEGSIKILEANFEHCKVGTRLIPINDPHIIGFYNPMV